MYEIDRVIAELAGCQLGLVTRAQLHEAGLHPRAIQRRAANGIVERIHPGVFRVAAAPGSWRQSVLAAVLAAGPGAVASHRSAAALHGIKGARGSVVEVMAERYRGCRLRGAILHRPLSFAAHDHEDVDSIPVTSVRRTLIDCAAVVHPYRLEEMTDDAVRRGMTSYEAIDARLRLLAKRGRTGIVAMRDLLEARLGERATGSVFESLAVAAIRAAQLPEPTLQHQLVVGGIVSYLDLAWPERMVALECDGWETHASPQALRSDLERQNRLTVAGWTLLRVAWPTMVETPGVVIAELRSVLGAPERQK